MGWTGGGMEGVDGSWRLKKENRLLPKEATG